MTFALLVAIVGGAVAIIWMLTASATPSANAVLIQEANTGRAANAGQRQPASSSNRPDPTATTPKLVLEGSEGEGSRPQGAIAEGTPGTILGVPSPTPAMISIYITGAVAQPGVYALPDGARVQDAISAAGGAMIRADLDSINLAQRLVDEAHITIGRRDDATPSKVEQPAVSLNPIGNGSASGQSLSQPAGAKPTPSAFIDINTATALQLEDLPGVGPSLAARIVADREKNGPFNSIEALDRVDGIGEGIIAKIRPYVTVTR